VDELTEGFLSDTSIDISDPTRCECVRMPFLYGCVRARVYMKMCVCVCVCSVQLQSSLRLVDTQLKGPYLYPQIIFRTREK
jgi:hypothetical protein